MLGSLCDNILHHLSLTRDDSNRLQQDHRHVDSTNVNLVLVDLTPHVDPLICENKVSSESCYKVKIGFGNG